MEVFIIICWWRNVLNRTELIIIHIYEGQCLLGGQCWASPRQLWVDWWPADLGGRAEIFLLWWLQPPWRDKDTMQQWTRSQTEWHIYWSEPYNVEYLMMKHFITINRILYSVTTRKYNLTMSHCVIVRNTSKINKSWTSCWALEFPAPGQGFQLNIRSYLIIEELFY